MTFARFYDVLDAVMSGNLYLWEHGSRNDQEAIQLQRIHEESKGFWFLQD